MNQRILQLALEALESRKAQIEKEIAQLQAELGSPVKKSHSEKMKAYWARKRAESAKLSAAQAPAAPMLKRKPKTAAQRKAQSKRMKAYWAKRKAKAAGRVSKS